MSQQKKLTLSINSKVVDAVKKFAAANDESLSAMVENFFIEKIEASFVNSSLSKKPKRTDFKGDFKKLRGIIKLPDDFDYKDFRRKHLEEKYLK
jgi:hypothetical protein